MVTVIELCENFQVDQKFSNMETKYEWILAITLLVQEIHTEGLIIRQELYNPADALMKTINGRHLNQFMFAKLGLKASCSF